MRRLLVALVVLLAATVPAQRVLAAEPPSHVPLFTIPPVGPLETEPLKNACGVAVDDEERVFVSNYYQHAVYLFALDPLKKSYLYVTQLPIQEPPLSSSGKPVDGPCDLALDSSGNLYVNNWHRNVVRFSPTSATTFGPGVVIDSGLATGVAIDPSNDHVLVNDRTSVAEYAPMAPEGTPPLRRIGLGSIADGYGVAVSGFAGAPGIPATAGRVYVGDAADGVVKVFDPSVSLTAPVQEIDGDGTPQAGFNRLVDTDIAVDARDGHIYVSDNLQPGFERPESVVHEFSSLGHYRGPVPAVVAAGHPSDLIAAEPTSVAISQAGNVFVTSGNYFDDGTIHRNSEVRVFGPTANVTTQILTATKSGAGSGIVRSTDPFGLRCGTACEGEFAFERTVVLAAEPERGNRFAGWSGCPMPLSGQRCAVQMLADATVDAEFEPIPQQQLSVSVSGSGSALSAPSGIDCGGGSCDAQFDQGSVVTLSASSAPGSVFAAWSGCDSEPTPGACTVTMSTARAVGASFAPIPEPPPPPRPPQPRRTLSVSSTALGTASGVVTSEPGGIDCGGSCAAVYGDGTTVTLTARPAAASAFVGWGGCDRIDGPRCTVTLGDDKTVVAAFGPGSPGPLRFRGLAVKGKTATLRVAVPAAGELTASSPRTVPVSTLPISPGLVALRLQLNAAGAKALARAKRHRLNVPIALALTPFEGGSPARARKTVVFGVSGKRAR